MLVELIEDRSSKDGWETNRLMGLLAGLQEVMPWVRQWHSKKDEDGTSWAEEYDGYLTSQRENRGLTEESLRSWLPPKPTRGRRSVKS